MIFASVLAALSGAAGSTALAFLSIEAFGSRGRNRRGKSSTAGDASPRVSLIGRLGRLIAYAPQIRGIKPPAELRAQLVAAGEPAGLGQREWIALKGGSAVLAAGTGLVFGSGMPLRLAVLLPVTCAAAGFMAPDLWLARLVQRRLEAAARDLPDMLDLLRVTVGAGMAPGRALGAVAAEFTGTLAYEWRRVAIGIALGLPHDEALEGLRTRLPAEEVRSLVDLLTRARRHGVPLGQALALQAMRAREHRRARVREQAARAGPKVQLVVALLLVPAVLLVVSAVLLAELERSGLFVGT